MAASLWTFEGFVAARGRRVVQQWYHDDLSEDDRDGLRDRLTYLANTPRHLWQEPRFNYFGDGHGEIRGRGALRIYGCFRDDEHFLFLNGERKEKK